MNGQSVIEGNYCTLPPLGFFTRAKAAFAIATKLYPDDVGRRAEAAARLDATIYDALCTGQLVGRDPDLPLPIERRDLAGAIMLAGCLISEPDINGWLAASGLNVRIAGSVAATYDGPEPTEPLPVRAASDMEPGAERDAAMLAAHEKFKKQGARNFLVRVAENFGVSTSTAKKCLRRARANRVAASPHRADKSISGGAAWARQFTTHIGLKDTQR